MTDINLASANEIKAVFPYLRVKDAAAAIAFYVQAFGARELFRLSEPNGRIGHAELAIGNATLMLSDEYPEPDILSPQSLGGTGTSIHLHVVNVDEVAHRAVAAGAMLVREPMDQFYGVRDCAFRDPSGNMIRFQQPKA